MILSTQISRFPRFNKLFHERWQPRGTPTRHPHNIKRYPADLWGLLQKG